MGRPESTIPKISSQEQEQKLGSAVGIAYESMLEEDAESEHADAADDCMEPDLDPSYHGMRKRIRRSGQEVVPAGGEVKPAVPGEVQEHTGSSSSRSSSSSGMLGHRSMQGSYAGNVRDGEGDGNARLSLMLSTGCSATAGSVQIPMPDILSSSLTLTSSKAQPAALAVAYAMLQTQHQALAPLRTVQLDCIDSDAQQQASSLIRVLAHLSAQPGCLMSVCAVTINAHTHDPRVAGSDKHLESPVNTGTNASSKGADLDALPARAATSAHIMLHALIDVSKAMPSLQTVRLNGISFTDEQACSLVEPVAGRGRQGMPKLTILADHVHPSFAEHSVRLVECLMQLSVVPGAGQLVVCTGKETLDTALWGSVSFDKRDGPSEARPESRQNHSAAADLHTLLTPRQVLAVACAIAGTMHTEAGGKAGCPIKVRLSPMQAVDSDSYHCSTPTKVKRFSMAMDDSERCDYTYKAEGQSLAGTSVGDRTAAPASTSAASRCAVRPGHEPKTVWSTASLSAMASPVAAALLAVNQALGQSSRGKSLPEQPVDLPEYLTDADASAIATLQLQGSSHAPLLDISATHALHVLTGQGLQLVMNLLQKDYTFAGSHSNHGASAGSSQQAHVGPESSSLSINLFRQAPLANVPPAPLWSALSAVADRLTKLDLRGTGISTESACQLASAMLAAAESGTPKVSNEPEGIDESTLQQSAAHGTSSQQALVFRLPNLRELLLDDEQRDAVAQLGVPQHMLCSSTLWDSAQGKEAKVTLTHSQTVPIPDAMHAAWLLESPLLLGAGRDGRLKLWDTFRRTHLGSLELGCWASRSTLEVLRNGAPDRRVEKGVGDHAIYALAVHPDGRHLVIGAADGVHILSGVDAAVAAWKAGKSAADVMDSFEHTGRLPGCHAPVACVACSPCGNFVAAGSMSEGFITIWTSNHTAQDRSHGPHPATGWDATSCQRIASINERVYELCFSADSNMLAAGGGGPTLQLLLHMPSRPGTSRVDPHPQPGTDSHPQPGTVAASFGGILPGASMIAPAQDAWATAALLAAKAWPAGPATWEKSISTTLCKREGVTSVAFSPGGGLVLGGCSQGRLALWKVPSEKDLEQNVLHAEHSKQSVPTCKPISFWSLPSGKDIGSVRGLCFQSPANKGAVSSTSLPTDAVILLALTHGAGTAASAKTPPNSANAAQAAAKGLRPKLLVIGLLEKGGLQLWDLLKPTVKGPQAATLRSLEEATLQQWPVPTDVTNAQCDDQPAVCKQLVMRTSGIPDSPVACLAIVHRFKAASVWRLHDPGAVLDEDS